MAFVYSGSVLKIFKVEVLYKLRLVENKSTVLNSPGSTLNTALKSAKCSKSKSKPLQQILNFKTDA